MTPFPFDHIPLTRADKVVAVARIKGSGYIKVNCTSFWFKSSEEAVAFCQRNRDRITRDERVA